MRRVVVPSWSARQVIVPSPWSALFVTDRCNLTNWRGVQKNIKLLGWGWGQSAGIVPKDLPASSIYDTHLKKTNTLECSSSPSISTTMIICTYDEILIIPLTFIEKCTSQYQKTAYRLGLPRHQMSLATSPSLPCCNLVYAMLRHISIKV